MAVSGSATRATAIGTVLDAPPRRTSCRRSSCGCARTAMPSPVAAGRTTSSRVPWFSSAGRSAGGDFRVAEHVAVARDERDARADARAERVGFRVRIGRARPLREQRRGQPRLGQQALCDVVVQTTRASIARRARSRRRARAPSRRSAEERARAKRHERGGWIFQPVAELFDRRRVPSTSNGIFSRSRRTCTSTVRVPPVYW